MDSLPVNVRDFANPDARPFPYNENRPRVCEWDVREALASTQASYRFPTPTDCSAFVGSGFVIIDTDFPPYSIILPYNELTVIPWNLISTHWPRNLCSECRCDDLYRSYGFNYVPRQAFNPARTTRLRSTDSDSELCDDRRRTLVRGRDPTQTARQFQTKRAKISNSKARCYFVDD